MPESAPYRMAHGRPVTDEPAPAPPPSRYPWWSLANRVRPARKRRGLPLREHLQGVGSALGIITFVWMVYLHTDLSTVFNNAVRWLSTGIGLIVLLLVVVIIILVAMLYRTRPRH